MGLVRRARCRLVSGREACQSWLLLPQWVSGERCVCTCALHPHHREATVVRLVVAALVVNSVVVCDDHTTTS